MSVARRPPANELVATNPVSLEEFTSKGFSMTVSSFFGSVAEAGVATWAVNAAGYVRTAQPTRSAARRHANVLDVFIGVSNGFGGVIAWETANQLFTVITVTTRAFTCFCPRRSSLSLVKM